MYLTNRRLIFLSDRRSAKVELEDLVAIEGGYDTLTVHAGSRERPIVLGVANPQKWALLARLLSSQELSGPKLPDGVNLHAGSTDRPGDAPLQADAGT